MRGERKNTIRKETRQRRSALSREERERKSGKIARSLAAHPSYRKARTVMFYLTHDSEVMTERMIRSSLKEGKNVVVPVVVPDRPGMMFAAPLERLDRTLARGACGVREPEYRPDRAVMPSDIDLVIVPGIAFDARGHRIGYGKGYYDRWLGQFSMDNRIALAFACQMVPLLPRGKNDIPVGWIITEEGVLKTRPRLSRSNSSAGHRPPCRMTKNGDQSNERSTR